MFKKHERGQIFSADFALGLIVFSAVLVLSFAFLSEAQLRSQESLQYAELQEHALNALNVLVYSQGSPANWDKLQLGQVSALGLANSRNVLNAEKLERLESLASSNYTEVKKLLGLQKFEFKLSVSKLGGEKILEFGNESEGTSFRANKIALLEQQTVLVSLEVFS